MPDLTQITGGVVLPDGSVPFEGRIHFTPTGWDAPAAGKVQPPATRTFVLGVGGGLVDVYLSPSTTSMREQPYRVSVTHFNVATRAMESTDLGLISVPEVAEGDSVSIRSLLSDPGTIPSAPDALAQIVAKALEVDADRALSETARDQTISAAARTYDTLAAMLADPTAWPAGTILSVRGLTDYQVVASGGDLVTGGRHYDVQMRAGRYPAEAFGLSESNTAAQNRVILRAALDKGPVSVGAGDWPLSWLIHKSGDDLWCSGADCCFVATTGVIFVYGPIKGDSFNAAGGSPRIALNPVAAGDTTITTTTPGHAAGFSVGDIIPIFCSAGYSDGEGHFKSAFQWITEVTSVNTTTGVIGIADAIYKDAPAGASMFTAAPLAVTNSEIEAEGMTHYGLTKGVRSGNFSVDSGWSESWSRFGGTYRSDIGPVFVRRSAGGFVNNGLAFSAVEIRSAKISKRVLDLAMFSHMSRVAFGPWSDNPAQASDGATLFAVAEGAHHNRIHMGAGVASHAQQRIAVLWLVEGADQNIVTADTVRAKSVQAVLRFNQTRDQATSQFPAPDSLIESGTFDVDQADKIIWLNATTAGDRIPARVSKQVKIRAASATDIINANSVGHEIDAEIDADAALTYLDGAKGCAMRSRLVRAPSAVNIAAGAYPDLSGVIIPDRGISFAAALAGQGSAIQSTSFVARYAKTLPVGLMRVGDALEFEILGLLNGTTGAKYIRTRLNGATSGGDVFFGAATVGAFHVRGVVKLIAAGAQRVFMVATAGAGLNEQVIRGSYSINETTTDILVEIGALVADVADGIAIEHVVVRPLTASL